MDEYNVNTQSTIGTTASVISVEKDLNNVRRVSIMLINTSTGGQTITLGIDNEAVANQGITLSPGGYWLDSKDAGYLPTQRQITAVSSAAGGLLSIQERLVKGA